MSGLIAVQSVLLHSNGSAPNPADLDREAEEQG